MSRQSFKNIGKLIDAEIDGSTTEQIFLQNLKDKIEIDNGSRKMSKTYKPSSLHCMRNMYYQIIGEDPINCRSDYCLVGMGESGTDRHERLQQYIYNLALSNPDYEWVDIEDYIKQNNIDYLEITGKDKFETKCYHKILNISFKCDGILKIKGHYHILEIKTESSFKFSKRTYVDPDHYSQAASYSIAFKINDVLFLYENRDNCDKKIYNLKVTDAVKESKVINKISECNNYVSNFVIPPKTDNTKFCKYCNYLINCKRAG